MDENAAAAALPGEGLSPDWPGARFLAPSPSCQAPIARLSTRWMLRKCRRPAASWLLAGASIRRSTNPPPAVPVPDSNPTMAPRKSPREFFGKGKATGSEQCNERINDSAVFKKGTPKVLKEYDRMIGLWNQYAENHAQDQDQPSPYKVKSLKDFVKEIAFGIDGVEGDPNPGQGIVLLYWKQFMAGWRRKHEAIPPNITLTVTNFINSELPEILKQESKISWVEYEKPATRVYDWADYMAIVCSFARIGEYIESSCRPGSGRGLYYKLVRDAKGTTDTFDKRYTFSPETPAEFCFSFVVQA
ncbi:hypothetical protein GGTG_13248 [Gaeumannomyces tritici R3-111a-1]|uniref:Uncharacterized protein n=1 Tax=Gaeumannomyces tritici (strain R3-111a-1) TaxID=644352 RepID=J3PIC0_GAET3|nr:hypothetical protein GGTG_13248 [Gaeumannomyces tritici R3-111a-1]EJT69139.1 hypothetical protein GGTG_13248 [Gaeumannomyces tritici R3-111a-1]